jgi:hypothetical protein
MDRVAPSSIEPGRAHNKVQKTRRIFPNKPAKKHDAVQPHHVDRDDKAELIDKLIIAQDVWAFISQVMVLVTYGPVDFHNSGVEALVSISRQTRPSGRLKKAFWKNVRLHNLYLSLLGYASLSEHEPVNTSTFLSHDATLESNVQIRTAISRKNGAYMPVTADNQQLDWPMFVDYLDRSIVKGNVPAHLFGTTTSKTDRGLSFTRW